MEKLEMPLSNMIDVGIERT